MLLIAMTWAAQKVVSDKVLLWIPVKWTGFRGATCRRAHGDQRTIPERCLFGGKQGRPFVSQPHWDCRHPRQQQAYFLETDFLFYRNNAVKHTEGFAFTHNMPSCCFSDKRIDIILQLSLQSQSLTGCFQSAYSVSKRELLSWLRLYCFSFSLNY